MTSLDTLIVKLSSRCNLGCTYCYEYFAGDESWKRAPKIMSTATARRLGQRIQQYCSRANVAGINLVLHGGEPLIVGSRRLDAILTALTVSAAPARLRLSVQTNGTLLTPDICDILRKHDVLVGISLDGGPNANSKRVTLKGDPTYFMVAQKIALLKSRAAHLFGGILCVVNFDADPAETIASLCAHNPPEIDLLYPFVTHDCVGPDRSAVANEFGRWMIAAMEYWIAHPRFAETKIRVFEDALQATVSRRPQTDWFGPRSISYLVVETGGNFDLLDQLKTIGKNSSDYRNLHGNVFENSIEDAMSQGIELLAKTGGNVLPTDCIGCKWSDVCAGSHLPSRHSLHQGFNNRSVYCEGIKSLLNFAEEKLVSYKEDCFVPSDPVPELRSRA